MKTIFFIVLLFGIVQAVPIVDKRPDQYLYKHVNLPWVMRESLEFLANSLRDQFKNLKLNHQPSKPSIDFDMIEVFEPMSVGPGKFIGTRRYNIGAFQDNFPWNWTNVKNKYVIVKNYFIYLKPQFLWVLWHLAFNDGCTMSLRNNSHWCIKS